MVHHLPQTRFHPSESPVGVTEMHKKMWPSPEVFVPTRSAADTEHEARVLDGKISFVTL
jgi:hypothetical protein